jgi:hypothetical protein
MFDIRFDDNETTFSFELSFRILRFLGLPPFNAVDEKGLLKFLTENRQSRLAQY